MTRATPLSSHEIDQILFPVLEMFMDGMKVKEIAAEVQKSTGIELSRERVYPLLREAVKRNYLLLAPPRDRVLTDLLHQFPNRGEPHVVNVRGKHAGAHVASIGGDKVYELIQQLAAERGKKEPIHLAFGIGWSTRKLVQRLAQRLGADGSAPPIVVHAISPPYSVANPLANPISAFADLDAAVPEVEYVPFVVTPIVRDEDYEDVIRGRVVQEAMQRKHEIDIVVTSLADAADPHGYLTNYLDQFEPSGIDHLRSEGWVGDVQLRPYSKRGPIQTTSGSRPVTMFELDDLVRFSKSDGKHVVLLVSPCGTCQRSKADAALPLLNVPRLHCWSHLVIDAETAASLVSQAVATGAGQAAEIAVASRS